MYRSGSPRTISKTTKSCVHIHRQELTPSPSFIFSINSSEGRNIYFKAIFVFLVVHCLSSQILTDTWGVVGTVASESTLRYAGTPQSRVQAPPPASWLGGGPESLRSP
ncbi:hypothetical protein PoB_004681500 [Plakobranchus ocellatus]|uniref:Uncharacterized protein n=1 Tax=Plakobranchus ocellatus TaxID=259542 RepID=A0AAV4BMP2_9GAST|nr:hypothetical protein PoB_004681500 [Plakobranchus ocellatus]